MKIRSGKTLVNLATAIALLNIVSCASNPTQPESGIAAESEQLASVNVAELTRKGDEALARRTYDEAQVSYALALKEQPDNIDLMYKLSVVHYEKQSYDVATELLTVIVSRNEQHAPAHEMLGLIELNNQNLDRVEPHLNTALAIEPNRWRSLNGMGVLKDMLGMHEDAQAYFTDALQRSPAKAKVENNLGYSHYLAGDIDTALQHFRNATRTNPSYDKAWANLALAYVRKNRLDDARYAFSKLVDDHVVSNNLGFLSMLQGDYATAYQELSRAIILSPVHYPTASENLATLKSKEYLAESIATDIPVVPRPVETVKAPVMKPAKSSNVVIKNAAYKKNAILDAKPRVPARRQADMTVDYLTFFGYSIDKQDSDSLRTALLSFQASFQLEPTGKADMNTRKALQSEAVRRAKLLLGSQGFKVGEESGLDEVTVASLRVFQQGKAIGASGKLNRETLDALATQ